ncbi:hypothetical protein VVT58_15535 [Sphingobium sp. SJ10-10]|uniref:hypothetical protein n=1 Tax=Sphingobium sp. SJ10-10 TaxID=3114999 RepID=UPI002E181121|nr:hypothetical protein [Sphingobium sp. SJ10-10]
MKPIVHAADCISFFAASPGPCDCNTDHGANSNDETDEGDHFDDCLGIHVQADAKRLSSSAGANGNG